MTALDQRVVNDLWVLLLTLKRQPNGQLSLLSMSDVTINDRGELWEHLNPSFCASG